MARKEQEMKKLLFSVFAAVAVAVFASNGIAQTGNVRVTVYNWGGSGAGAGKQVVRFDSLYRPIDSLATNSGNQVYWSNIPAQLYWFEAYDSTGRAIWGSKAYWGNMQMRVVAGQTVNGSITQIEPYIEQTRVFNQRGRTPPFNRGDTAYFEFTVRNRFTGTRTSSVYCRADVNRSSPWDFDEWSGWVNIGSGSSRLFVFTFPIPRTTPFGTVYNYTARVGTQYPGSGYDVSDQKYWMGSFLVGVALEEPEKHIMKQGFSVRPNPFSSSTTFSLSLAKESYSSVSIYNLEGRIVRTLSLGKLKAGEHVIQWDGRDLRGRVLSPGAYFVRATCGEFTATEKVVITR
jgi:hypothetical protein